MKKAIVSGQVLIYIVMLIFAVFILIFFSGLVIEGLKIVIEGSKIMLEGLINWAKCKLTIGMAC